MSPTQITSRNLQTCRDCEGHECINGVTEPNPVSGRHPITLQDGCQLELFVPTIQSNMDCTFCLDCVRACPYDNVALTVRPPGDELFKQTWRNRLDLALLPILIAYAGLINAFAMTPPVFSLEAWLAGMLNTQSEAVVLGIVFLVSVLLVPLLLVYGAAWISRLLTSKKSQPSGLLRNGKSSPLKGEVREGAKPSLNKLVMRYAYSFIPRGFPSGLPTTYFTF